MELELVTHIKRMANMLFGFTLMQFKRVAYDYAEACGTRHNFNHRKREAGKDWCHEYMDRNKDAISLRIPEPTSAARAKESTREPSPPSLTY